MTKKDYELVASVIRQQVDLIGRAEEFSISHTIILDELACLSRYMADKFEENNTRFDRDKFLVACGMK